MPDAKGTHKNV